MLAAAAGKATGKLLRKLGIYEQVTSTASEVSRVVRGVFNFLVVVAVLAFLGSMFYGGWEIANEAGWVSHERTTVITARADWLIGESKTCESFRLTADAAKLFNADENSVIQRINCDGGAEHTISVTFWGRIVRPDRRAIVGVNWRCVKKIDSFTCYALN